MQQPVHQPAMVAETLAYFGSLAGKRIADFTLGDGGHARHLLEGGATVIGLDRDPESLRRARENLAPFADRATIIHGRMSQAEDLLEAAGVRSVDGVLIDAGISMSQLKDPERGFSAFSDSIEMRYDRTSAGSITAFEVVNGYLDKELQRVFRITGRGREERQVAARIVAARQRGPIQTTAELALVIAAAIARGKPPRRLDAAPYLMAIRAEVNNELPELVAGLEAACRLLSPLGKVAALSWHSAEFRACKETLRRLANPCRCPPAWPCVCGLKPVVNLLTPRPLSPSDEEVARNPAARSARLHVAEKLPPEGPDGPGEPGGLDSG